MSKLYEVVATVGKYQKDGQTKYLNKTVGSIIETKHGNRLKLAAWFNPSGCEKDEDGSVWLALFPPKDKSQGRATDASASAGGGDHAAGDDGFSDDIPF